MQRNVIMIRMLAAAGAVAIVAGAMLALSGYSNAKYEIAAAAAQHPYAAESVQLAIEPARIDVVVSRLARTRAVVHVQEVSVPRPQS